MGRSLIIMVSGLLAIFSVFQLSGQKKQAMALDRSYNYYRNQQARDIANSLMEKALVQLENDVSWRDGYSYDNFLNGSGNVQVDDEFSDSTVSRYEIRITSTGTVKDITREAVVMMRRTSFSKYSYFTNVEPGIYFISGDTIHGPSHTNGPFHLWGSPVFTGEVTSPHMWRGRGDPEFLGGYNFASNYVTLPTDLTPLQNAAADGGITLDQTAKLVFNPDGTVDISYSIGNGVWGQPDSYNLSDINGVISSSKNVYVKGVINGQITLHSSRNIHIIGDITYADNPINNPASEDMMGIIAEQRVIVDDGAELDHGTQDLHIESSIMALGNSFTVEHFGVGDPRGRLWILGGVVQETRGAVGTFTTINGETVLRSGYQKSYKYDERLMTQWPPYYPVQTTFSILSWRES